MTQPKETYALLLPFSSQDLPATTSAADLSSSRAADAALALSGSCTQRARRTMIGVTALLSVTLLMVAFPVAARASSRMATGPMAMVRLDKSGPVDKMAVIETLKATERGDGLHRNKSAGMNRAHCHTAVAGEECYNHIIYTKQEAIKYPKWYPGISRKSRLVDVQRHLQQTPWLKGVCPEPCEMVEEGEEMSPEESSVKECHTALPGEACYSDILSAIDDIARHPERYPGLTNYSAKEHFQAFLHGRSSADKEAERKTCPMPCDRKAVEEVSIRATCQTASEMGDACYEGVRWAATIGIRKHPSRYPDLSKNSSVEEFQLQLHAGPKAKCPMRPCPCHTHVEGEPCYDSVMWIKEVGLRKHPGSFGGLTNASSFEEIQAHLHAERTTPCLRPCTPLPW